jgi:hypothetical protein
LIDMQIEVIQKETERWMDICGSSGKAWKGNRPMTQQHCTVISTERILLLYCTTAWCFQTRLIAIRANVVLFLKFLCLLLNAEMRCWTEYSVSRKRKQRSTVFAIIARHKDARSYWFVRKTLITL